MELITSRRVLSLRRRAHTLTEPTADLHVGNCAHLEEGGLRGRQHMEGERGGPGAAGLRLDRAC